MMFKKQAIATAAAATTCKSENIYTHTPEVHSQMEEVLVRIYV
jgi:hypothetical protein